ncbi:pyridoxal phosphate-dependent aminotransferase [Fictibacillus sp. KIGAM418]|uniref:cysteine-S-conjugate beta-lyase n=1 Tax=Fictibacillus marinisediminis TaxID=2878389 RepID=A0A9X1XDX9_9BACL|nr:MalY/PatB family protein [Fictibacillus marinisediminis]MCK6257265.1 pyridoxal phosphate-dependent aminotransferase [Fictibacillus marinisediminis]
MKAFNEKIDRMNTHSVKWDHTKEIFGKEDLLPMWVADMDFKAPHAVIDAMKKRIDHGIFGYSMATKETKQIVMDWLKSRHTWEIQSDWIVFTPGVVPALSAAIHTYTETNDGVLIQSPVYYPFGDMVKKNNRKLISNSLRYNGETYEMDFEDLELQFRTKNIKLMLLCNPHNPVGRVWTKEELGKLAKLCIQYDVLVFSDDIHFDLIYKKYRHTILSSLSPEIEERTITGIAPSKTFNLAGLQFSTIIIPNKTLRDKFSDYLATIGFFSPGSLGIIAAEAAYQNGEEWLDGLMEYLESNLDYLKNFIKEKLPQIKVIEPEGTYLVWLDCSNLNMDHKRLESFIQDEAKLAFDEGYIFGKEGEGFERINIACPLETLKEGLTRLEKAINKQNVV